jgi:hypothetical protein
VESNYGHSRSSRLLRREPKSNQRGTTSSAPGVRPLRSLVAVADETVSCEKSWGRRGWKFRSGASPQPQRLPDRCLLGRLSHFPRSLCRPTTPAALVREPPRGALLSTHTPTLTANGAHNTALSSRCLQSFAGVASHAARSFCYQFLGNDMPRSHSPGSFLALASHLCDDGGSGGGVKSGPHSALGGLEGTLSWRGRPPFSCSGCCPPFPKTAPRSRPLFGSFRCRRIPHEN